MESGGYVTVQPSRKVHYLIWGDRNGTAVVLIHGHPGRATTWDRVVRALGDHHLVIAVDLAGHGDSDWAETYAIDSWTEDVERVVSELDLGRFTLVGHSLGATIGFRYAELFPDQLSRLIAVDGLPLGAWEPTTPNAGALPPRFGSLRECEDFYRRTMGDRSAEDLSRIIERNLRPGGDGGLVWRHDLAARDAILRELKFDDYWPSAAAVCTVPVTYVRCGRSHVADHARTSTVLDHFPDHRLITLPDTGHDVLREAPVALAEIIHGQTG